MTEKNRISRVVTRSGDGGETGLADGSRWPKDAPVIAALGDLDELNAMIGMLRSRLAIDQFVLLDTVQQRLFDLGAELAVPGTTRLTDADVSEIEAAVEQLNEQLPPLREFVLPGGHPDAALCHLCRTVARRAERALVAAVRDQQHSATSLRWLNRLSDFLFVLARTLNRINDSAEPQWRPR
ncbi:cob(I)yrinic acid a,c-diamide adenosyltransferase [Alcanivorax sp. 1008]|uniref:cob(I)yrinic acid a,c-diamide adenosyltransferase n=1 Tax=Alcanivorax sp. 1008 TaxID=2816853 RepID=UPI001DF7394A|nr:cob(I)yrinic acid a,c-diamide adenosyltransferase [Alcanivorax sp. 1008]MCC1495384.1 cob(I)yrinic acid a,c-diamide adenosyltransferase [Alcanivorax sp. 1008]